MTRLSENNFQLSFPNYTVIVFTLYLKFLPNIKSILKQGQLIKIQDKIIELCGKKNL